MKKILIILSLFLFLPFGVLASGADLSLSQGSIEFSEEKLIVGDTIRIYATVRNVGDVDTSGYVTFFQGSLPIGDSQVISLRSEGSPEEVYVDFVVPAGSFNIRAEIRGTDPVDENSANDVVITQLFTPIFDDDRDGIENDNDNCPNTENADQADNDLDGIGDVCDDDDDNDGLTDGVEKELDTSTTSADSDGDGINDADDPHPTIPESQIVVEEENEPVTTTLVEYVPEESSQTNSASDTSEGSGATEGSDDSAVTSTGTDGTEETVEETDQENSENSFSVSPKAVFAYLKKDWNTFEFYARLPSTNGYRVSWDFGDGTTSNKTEIEHVYSKSGDYLVKISVEGVDGQVAEDSLTIHVSFFSLGNPLVKFIISFLLFVFVVLIYFFWRTGRRNQPPKNKSVSVPVDDLEDEEKERIPDYLNDEEDSEEEVEPEESEDKSEKVANFEAPIKKVKISVRHDDSV